MRREVLWKLKRNIGGGVLLLVERYNRRATSVGDRVRIDESSSFAGRYIQVSGGGGGQQKRGRESSSSNSRQAVGAERKEYVLQLAQ